MSDKNIYLSIYSLESYIFNKELLKDEDKVLMNKLRDKFNESFISEIIEEVRSCLKQLVLNSDYFIEAEVYFNPKKYEDGKVKFRPLHTSSIINQIVLVSMLNMFIYEFNDGNEKLELSNISRLIPSNFYGNRVSTRPEVLFKPWKTQYKLYTEKANELFKTYHTTREYKYEVDLDLENFFPSVHPQMLYNLILSLIPITINEMELGLYKIILIKLLVCKIKNLDSNSLNIYYGEALGESGAGFSRGIVQGLPQSYFFGNICMIEISKIFEKHFRGRCLYYVDDSVIFSNDIANIKDFEKKLQLINEDIKQLVSKYIELEDNNFFRMYSEELITFLRDGIFSIKVHDISGKSTYTEIKQASEGEIHLRSLSRAVSQVGFDLYTTYSDEEDDNLNAKMGILLRAISKEQELLKERFEKTQDESERESLEGYKAKLIRYHKFFKYRKLKIDIQRNNEAISIKDGTIAVPVQRENFLEAFLEVYRQDIWGAYVGLCIKSNTEEKYLERIKNYILEVNNNVFGYDNHISSYIYKSFRNLFYDVKSDIVYQDPYETVGKLANKKLGKYRLAHGDIVNEVISGEIQQYHWEKLLKETRMFSDKFLETVSIVDNSTAELKRMVLNSIYSQLFNIQLNDSLVLQRKTKRNLLYGELRILALIRNDWFSEEIYRGYHFNLTDEKNRLKVDYSIMEVLDVFKTFVKHPVLIDNLILVHQYTCDVWKNGSKYLYFYTLHNQEHAIDLIKNVVKIIKAIDYLQISKNDFYIIFISCYLHDISMVKIPSTDEFLLNDDMADVISMEYFNAIDGKSITDYMDIKILLANFYKEIDVFFENQVRRNHAKDSADEIRNRDDLKFLDDCLREKIAEISFAHGQRVEDIYNIKSHANSSLFSTKFDKILLRIADLLDMSSYRVSKPILSHNMEQMSGISAFHWISHLLTKGYKLEIKYRILDEEKPVLIPKQIEEKIILHIDIAFSQLSKMENMKGCKHGKIDVNSISPEGFVIKCGESCSGENCNFLCKWFTKKNEYLLIEFAALKAYLNRTPRNFYATDIEIHLHILDKTKLDAQQFEILKANLL